jgi:predicted nucleic acid-binding protein
MSKSYWRKSELGAKSVYIDSNIFISSLIYERSEKAMNSKRVLASVEKGEVAAYTSTLTWDEVVWVVRRVLGRADSVQAGAKLADYPNLRFVSTSEEIIRSAQRLLSEYQLAPRDAIHVASALSKPVDALISDDSELDIVREVRREASDVFDPKKSTKPSDRFRPPAVR